VSFDAGYVVNLEALNVPDLDDNKYGGQRILTATDE
jgi:hypothetical protein